MRKGHGQRCDEISDCDWSNVGCGKEDLECGEVSSRHIIF